MKIIVTNEEKVALKKLACAYIDGIKKCMLHFTENKEIREKVLTPTEDLYKELAEVACKNSEVTVEENSIEFTPESIVRDAAKSCRYAALATNIVEPIVPVIKAVLPLIPAVKKAITSAVEEFKEIEEERRARNDAWQAAQDIMEKTNVTDKEVQK